MTKPAPDRFLVPPCLAVILVLVLFPVAGRGGTLSFQGYFKSYPILFRPAPVYGAAAGGRGPATLGLASNRFRLQFSYNPKSWISLNAAYDLSPRMQSRGLANGSLLFGSIDPYIYRAKDFRRRVYPSPGEPAGRFELDQNLDRAVVVVHTKGADISIGRQPIAWGSARVINPTDVLAPFTFEELDTEDRLGVDAVRVRVPLGALSEIDMGYVFGRDFRFGNSAAFARTRFNAYRTDVSLLLLVFQENLMAGFDLARPIGGAGYWFEAAYVWVDKLGGNRTAPDSNYLRFSTGFDYSFSSRTYGFIEYHFNGAGSADPQNYMQEFSRTAYTEGAVYLMGRHYAAPGVTCQLTPLITLTGQLLFNLTDPSAFLGPQAEYNIAANFYVGAGAYIGIGGRPQAVTGGGRVLASEFGSYPDMVYGSFRFYF